MSTKGASASENSKLTYHLLNTATMVSSVVGEKIKPKCKQVLIAHLSIFENREHQ